MASCMASCTVASAVSLGILRLGGGAVSCWSGAFSARVCCDTDLYGPGGNADCWEDDYTFSRCCSGESVSHAASEEGAASDYVAGGGLLRHGAGDSGLCWGGIFSEASCCDTAVHGPQGREACWSDGLDFARCCRGHGGAAHGAQAAPPGRTTPSTTAPPTAAAPSRPAADPGDQRGSGDSGLAVSRRCWRSGFSFYKCCARSQPGGNPECWDGREFTFQRCCLPPETTPASLFFEDMNCERGAPEWRPLQEHLVELVSAADQGQLGTMAQSAGGFGTWSRSYRRLLSSAVGECPIGRVSLRAASLLLCLASSAGPRNCGAEWAGTAAAMRGDALSTTQWSATRWPVLGLFRHISGIVRGRDPTCRSGAGGVDWELLHGYTQDTKVDLSNQASQVIFDMSIAGQFQAECEGGHQWASTVKMSWCARTEVRCVRSYTVFLDWKMRQAAVSGAALRQWLALAGDWNLHGLHSAVLRSVMRHRYTLGLTPSELQLLGMEVAQGSEHGCVDLSRHTGDIELLPLQDGISSWYSENCRAQCGWSRTRHGLPWTFFGLSWEDTLQCLCTGPSVRVAQGNCTALGHVMLHRMPPLHSAHGLIAALVDQKLAAPTLASAAHSLASLEPGEPVFATMVFGHMARHIPRFARRVRGLRIPNVVAFVLDEDAAGACHAARETKDPPHLYCLRGDGKTALQKYIVILAYVALGRDVFWFDFDSVWLQNPVPALRAAEAAAGLRAAEGGSPAPDMYAAIDLDSKNCVMNAFFWVKASSTTRTWLLSLMNWLYKRPYAHDQLAFALFLGIGPLVDDEPLPAPLTWVPLDPNTFANAARFSGLGFSSDVEDLVLFHFFDGWNSNQPDDVEQYMTPVYRGENLFESLYSDGEGVARAALLKSRLPPPAELKDCSFMDSLGLGVPLKDEAPMAIPPA